MNGAPGIARPRGSGSRPVTFARWSMYGFFVLAVLSWGYIFGWTDNGVGDLLSADSWSDSGRFIRQLAGQESRAVPAFANADRWIETGKLAYETLAMSVLAIGLTGLAAFPTFVFGARNVSGGELGGAPSKSGVVLYYAVRLTFAVTRAVPELVWAMIIVFRPGCWPEQPPWPCTTMGCWASCRRKSWRIWTPAHPGPCARPAREICKCYSTVSCPRPCLHS